MDEKEFNKKVAGRVAELIHGENEEDDALIIFQEDATGQRKVSIKQDGCIDSRYDGTIVYKWDRFGDLEVSWKDKDDFHPCYPAGAKANDDGTFELTFDKTSDECQTPPHYQLDPEPIEVIRGWGLNFCLGNVIKYIARAGHKDGESRDADLHKAMHYLRMEVENE